MFGVDPVGVEVSNSVKRQHDTLKCAQYSEPVNGSLPNLLLGPDKEPVMF